MKPAPPVTRILMPAIIPKSSEPLRSSARKLLAWYGRHGANLPGGARGIPTGSDFRGDAGSRLRSLRSFLLPEIPAQVPGSRSRWRAPRGEVLAACRAWILPKGTAPSATARALRREHGGRFPRGRPPAAASSRYRALYGGSLGEHRLQSEGAANRWERREGSPPLPGAEGARHGKRSHPRRNGARG
jgi:hypothetical protein